MVDIADSFFGIPDDPYRDVPPPEDDPGRSDERGRSWRPIDLGPVVRGELTRPEPAVGLSRTDGLRLLYRGKEHAVLGEMEAGKSWFCLACAAAELAAGNHVVYVHFEEADPTDSVERLQTLGVADVDILDRFRFVAPAEPVTVDLLAALLDPVPSLVVLDGVNEGMALHGHGIREEDGVAAFRRRLVKPCTAMGVAVLAADHVVKSIENRGRYALGSVHKGNAIDGSLILLESVEPFGRDRRGVSHVFVTKDRPGYLRRHGQQSRTSGKTFMGSLIVDDERTWKSYLDLTFTDPPDTTDSAPAKTQDQEDDEHVLSIVAEIETAGMQATTRTVRAKSSCRNERTSDALTRLVFDGKLTERSGSRGSRIFSMPSAPVTGSGFRP